MVEVELGGVGRVFGRGGVPGAGEGELEDDGVAVGGLVVCWEGFVVCRKRVGE